MWSHYADSHKGFCIGFDTEKIVKQAFGQFMKVKYSDEIPYISIFDDDKGLMNKLIYIKSKAWDYEDEYRITKILKPDSKVYFSPETISLIYLGIKMPLDSKMEIINLVKHRKELSHVRIFEMTLGSEKFELVPARVF